LETQFTSGRVPQRDNLFPLDLFAEGSGVLRLRHKHHPFAAST
jgi:hypothetical protein